MLLINLGLYNRKSMHFDIVWKIIIPIELTKYKWFIKFSVLKKMSNIKVITNKLLIGF